MLLISSKTYIFMGAAVQPKQYPIVLKHLEPTSLF